MRSSDPEKVAISGLIFVLNLIKFAKCETFYKAKGNTSVEIISDQRWIAHNTILARILKVTDAAFSCIQTSVFDIFHRKLA